MSSIKDKIGGIVEQIRAAQKELTEKAKAAFTDACKELFEQNPTLQSFSWRQYTPYFNDGDTCTFSANTDYLEINGDDVPYRPATTEQQETVRLDKVVKEVLCEMPEDVLETVFGDHVKVIVTRDGATTEEYDHD